MIGSTRSAAKVKHLIDDLRFDAAFNYRDGPVAEQLGRAAPDGIHVYLDNVGGEHLEAALGSLREFGRIAWCGAAHAAARLLMERFTASVSDTCMRHPRTADSMWTLRSYHENEYMNESPPSYRP